MRSEDYLKGYNDGYKKACEVLEGTSKGLDLPEASDDLSAKEIMDRMQKDIDRFFEQITKLQGNLCKVEKAVFLHQERLDSLEELADYSRARISNNREDINTLWEKVKP